jgi:DNA-nicking Smr family endonuclease
MIGQLSEQDEKDWDLYIDRIFNSPEEHLVPIKEQVILKRRVDLHGMTVAEAHHTATEFLAEHAEAGSENVVVITGKSGQIAHEFTEWCRQLPWVRRYEPIVDSRGGVGSYRIWLRKNT